MSSSCFTVIRVVFLVSGLAATAASNAAELVRCASPNFEVLAPTGDVARQVAAAAEKQRRLLAIRWFGRELPRWSARCPVTVRVGANLGAGGSTKFRFERGHVLGWRMNVQGSLERILDSVIPHEVNHTILACYFRRPVPRWADEGAATMIEHHSEQASQLQLVDRLVHQGRRIPLRVLFGMKQYPRDASQLRALYAQGYSLTEFLIQQEGFEKFLHFLKDAHHRGWDNAVRSNYRKRDIEDLERSWANWVIAGSPKLNVSQGQLVAMTGREEKAATAARSRPTPSNPKTIRTVMTEPVPRRRTIVKGRPEPQHSTSPISRTIVRAQNSMPSPTTTKPRLLSRDGLRQLLKRDSNEPEPVIIRRPVPQPIALRQIDADKPTVVARPRRESTDTLQPLALLRVESNSAAARQSDRNVEAIPLPEVSLQAAFGSALQETNLRSADTMPSQLGTAPDWARFPGR